MCVETNLHWKMCGKGCDLSQFKIEFTYSIRIAGNIMAVLKQELKTMDYEGDVILGDLRAKIDYRTPTEQGQVSTDFDLETGGPHIELTRGKGEDWQDHVSIAEHTERGIVGMVHVRDGDEQEIYPFSRYTVNFPVNGPDQIGDATVVRATEKNMPRLLVNRPDSQLKTFADSDPYAGLELRLDDSGVLSRKALIQATSTVLAHRVITGTAMIGSEVVLSDTDQEITFVHDDQVQRHETRIRSGFAINGSSYPNVETKMMSGRGTDAWAYGIYNPEMGLVQNELWSLNSFAVPEIDVVNDLLAPLAASDMRLGPATLPIDTTYRSVRITPRALTQLQKSAGSGNKVVEIDYFHKQLDDTLRKWRRDYQAPFVWERIQGTIWENGRSLWAFTTNDILKRRGMTARGLHEVKQSGDNKWPDGAHEYPWSTLVGWMPIFDENEIRVTGRAPQTWREANPGLDQNWGTEVTYLDFGLVTAKENELLDGGNQRTIDFGLDTADVRVTNVMSGLPLYRMNLRQVEDEFFDFVDGDIADVIL